MRRFCSYCNPDICTCPGKMDFYSDIGKVRLTTVTSDMKVARKLRNARLDARMTPLMKSMLHGFTTRY